MALPCGGSTCFVFLLRQTFLCIQKSVGIRRFLLSRGAGVAGTPPDPHVGPGPRPQGPVWGPRGEALAGHHSLWSCCSSRPAGLDPRGALWGSCLEPGFSRGVGPFTVPRATSCPRRGPGGHGCPQPLSPLILEADWGADVGFSKTWARLGPCPDAASGRGRGDLPGRLCAPSTGPATLF